MVNYWAIAVVNYWVDEHNREAMERAGLQQDVFLVPKGLSHGQWDQLLAGHDRPNWNKSRGVAKCFSPTVCATEVLGLPPDPAEPLLAGKDSDVHGSTSSHGLVTAMPAQLRVWND